MFIKILKGELVMLKSFAKLTEAEMLECYKFIKEKRKKSKQSFEEFMEYNMGEAFNHGENFYTAFADGTVDGTVGIVTREVPVRGEAFIFNFVWNVREGKSTAELLEKAVKVCTDAESPVAKLGIAAVSEEELPSAITEQGFEASYEALNMRLPRCKCLTSSNMKTLEFVTVKDENMEDYVRIHNNAFRRAPNGGDISLEELGKDVQGCSDKPELIGLVKYDNAYAGIYYLEVKEGIGWINTVGIHEDYCSKGLGEELVRKCVDMFNTLGVKEIKLTVISSNERAFSLYKKLGFVVEEIISSWFVKELK